MGQYHIYKLVNNYGLEKRKQNVRMHAQVEVLGRRFHRPSTFRMLRVQPTHK